MIWQINLTEKVYKFFKKNQIPQEQIFEVIKKAIKKFQGESINVDIKKLKGIWADFYRIRKGEIRIIVKFDFDNLTVLVEEIDWRGNVYK